MNNYEKDLEKCLEIAERNLFQMSSKEREKKLREIILRHPDLFDETHFKEIEENIIKKLGNEKFILYGAGGGGVLFLDFFCKKYKIFPEYVLDKLEKWDENKIYLAEELGKKRLLKATSKNLKKLNKNCKIIITVYKKDLQNEIKEKLVSEGFNNLIFIPDELFEYFNYKTNEITWNVSYENIWKSYISINNIKICLKNKNKFIEIIKFLSDEKSKEIYYKCVKDFIFLTTESPYDSLEKQYFPEDINLVKGYNVFIDCGSWRGDTIIKLNQFFGKIKTLICFEPNLGCFNFLQRYLNCNKNKIADKIFILPCGVYSKEKFFKFQIGPFDKGQSHISEKGEKMIFCVPLDKILLNFKPTFIKMDIEGAELEALKGAKRIIKEYRPDLAICIYHHPEHFWKIPFYIKKLVPEYNIYIRKYGGQFITEAVLYATVGR